MGGSPWAAVRRHSEIRVTVLRCPPTYFSSILQSGHFKLHVAGGYVLYEFHFVPRGPSNTFVLTKGDGKPKTSPAWENSLSGPLPAQSGPGPRWQLWRLLGGHVVTSGPPPPLCPHRCECASVLSCRSGCVRGRAGLLKTPAPVGLGLCPCLWGWGGSSWQLFQSLRSPRQEGNICSTSGRAHPPPC